MPPPTAEELARPALVPQIEPKVLSLHPRRKKRGKAFRLARSGDGDFTLPSLDLLEQPPDILSEIDRNALTETAQRLTQKLSDFGIKGRVETIRPGPVITMYEFVPAPGIRVSKIASLADDLAMAMEALQVRIVAPIPGKSVVGIEVPNRQRAKVYLREVLEEDGFQKMTSPLTLAFGKDTEGVPYLSDLTRMPHLLVAGTTGSGKSVSMNSMIMSLLFKATPEDVRMIMIDPKMVELSMYEGIPHLLLPVVQDTQKAPLALRWAVEEMERRYHLLGKLRVKDLKAYNEKVEKLRRGEVEPEAADTSPKRVLVVDVANGETEEEALARLAEETPADGQSPAPTSAASADDSDPGQPEEELEKLPYLVIIIDELADLMMVASREVEQCISRLAAKARAAGIHLVVATQRPSTDVVSGVIKSNLPVRIAFRLASRHDSATIINGPGAERLLGEGDMLHIPPGGSDPLRLHGAWVRENEIERVVEFWKRQGKPVYDEEILRPRSDGREGTEDDVPDELYDQALLVVSQLERVSISLLQRKMGVGYNRVADLIERLERDRIIGPANGIKPREVLVRGSPELGA
jgi:S-DNA-T family DNA segregation ATPase FtsK/SpoIIIE